MRYIQQCPLRCETSSSMVGPKNQDFAKNVQLEYVNTMNDSLP